MKRTRNNYVIGIVALIVVVALVVIFTLSGKSDTSNGASLNIPVEGAVDNTLANEVVSESDILTESDISSHNNGEDCWIAYKGKVYDVTEFLPKHPGSAGAIIPYCGTSSGFEEAFTKKHGTSKASMLMKVGVLIGDFEKVGNI